MSELRVLPPIYFNLTARRIRNRKGVVRTLRRTSQGQARYSLENHQRTHAAPYAGQRDPYCNACRELQKQLEEATQ